MLIEARDDFKINSFVKKALVYSKLRHRGTLLFKCSDKQPANHGNYGCPRCNLIELLTRKNKE